ncbi:hypothetical protein C8J57DRAFT_1727233 [Mycena rebaudengoi]|nr:hypothetical protein C8J57DRAFT_1727233 [Mycena rebaudengoi]
MGRRCLTHVSRVWRFVVFGTPRFWSRFLVDASTDPGYLSHALSLSGKLGLFVRLYFPYAPSDVVPRPTKVENISAIVGALQPYWLRIVSAQITVFDGDSLDEVRAMMVGGRFKFPFLRTLTLRAISHGNVQFTRRLTSTGIHGSGFARLDTLRLRHVRVVWPRYIILTFLHTLVLRDMTGRLSPSWNDYRYICCSAPHLRKLCIRYSGCIRMPDTPYILFAPLLELEELDIVFGDSISLAKVLRNMRLPMLRVVRFGASKAREVLALAGCGALLSRVTHFEFLGGSQSAGALKTVFLQMPSLYSIDLRSSELDVLGALLAADLQLYAGTLAVNACPLLADIAVINMDPIGMVTFLQSRAVAIDCVRRITFRRDIGSNDNYLEARRWMQLRGIQVRLGVMFVLPKWIGHFCPTLPPLPAFRSRAVHPRAVRSQFGIFRILAASQPNVPSSPPRLPESAGVAPLFGTVSSRLFPDAIDHNACLFIVLLRRRTFVVLVGILPKRICLLDTDRWYLLSNYRSRYGTPFLCSTSAIIGEVIGHLFADGAGFPTSAAFGVQ